MYALIIKKKITEVNSLINTNISFCIFTTYLRCNLFSMLAVLLAETLLNFFLPAVEDDGEQNDLEAQR